MGWTHYWQRDAQLAPEAFASAVADLKAVLPGAGVRLAGPEGVGEPVLEADRVLFNGEEMECYEPFVFMRVVPDDPGQAAVWGFCKTDGLPYDLCVQVALVVLHHHLGDALAVASDGSMDDWRAAVGRVQQHLGYGSEFRLATLD